MSVPHLQLGISDAALMAACDEPNGVVELCSHRKLQIPAWVRWFRSFMPGWWPGFRAGGCFWILSNRQWPWRWPVVMQ
jgi:hypothetical protein